MARFGDAVVNFSHFVRKRDELAPIVVLNDEITMINIMDNCFRRLQMFGQKSENVKQCEDNSAKYERSADRTSFISIWPVVRGKIWRLLSQKDRTNIRKTSRYFKKEIEILGGLHVKVSSKVSASLNYVKNVEATRCRLLDLKDDFFKDDVTSPFRCLYSVNKLDVLTRMSYIIMGEMILPMASTLRYIEFRQISLMTRYINPNENTNDEIQLVEFTQLATLIFHYGVTRHGTLDNFQIFNANMIYLLSLIDAPNLTVFNICPVHSVLSSIVLGNVIIPHEFLRWESKSLKLFIARHRFSLRKLNISLYRTKLTPEERHYASPKFLTDYSCYISRLRPQLYDNGDPEKELFPNLWSKILRKSKQLSTFSAQVENWGRIHRFLPDLRIAVTNNYSSLTTILINSYHTRNPGLAEHHLTLDMGVFALCASLKVLHIRLTSLLKFNKKGQSESETYTAMGIEKLPSSIQSFQFKNVLCYSSELLYIAKLPFLTSCQLLHCGKKGNHGVTYEIAKTLFTHKKLRYIKIADINEENNLGRMMTLVKKFNDGLYEQEIEIHNPHQKISKLEYVPCCCCMKAPGTENVT